MIKGAINRPVTVSMFLLAISLFGYISLDRLALNLLPDISYPTLTIQTEYSRCGPGRSREPDHAAHRGSGRRAARTYATQFRVTARVSRKWFSSFNGAPRWIARVWKRARNSMWFNCLAMQNARCCCDSILRTTRSCGCVCPART